MSAAGAWVRVNGWYVRVPRYQLGYHQALAIAREVIGPRHTHRRQSAPWSSVVVTLNMYNHFSLGLGDTLVFSPGDSVSVTVSA